MGTTDVLQHLFNEADRDLVLSPFLVAHIERSQDQLILGPTQVGAFHDQFIDDLYHGLNYAQPGLVLKLFRHKNRLCFASIFGTTLSDEGGRENLALSTGVILNGVDSDRLRLHAALFLELMWDVLNELFGISFPQDGASNLLQMLNSAPDRDVIRQRLQLASRVLLLAGGLPKQRSRTSLWQRLIRLANKSRPLPREILYDPRLPPEAVLRIYSTAVLRSSSARVHSTDSLSDETIISLRPAPEFLNNADTIRASRLYGSTAFLVYGKRRRNGEIDAHRDTQNEY